MSKHICHRVIIGKLYRSSVYIVTGKKLDEAAFDEMRRQGQISNHLKAPKARILDDLNGVLSPLQRRVMKKLLSRLDELNEHIRNLATLAY